MDGSFILFLATAAFLAAIFGVLYIMSKNHKINKKKTPENN